MEILWMMGFERFNLFLKNLVRNGHNVGVHLANAVAIDMAAAYSEMLRTGINYDVLKAPQHTCFLQQPLKHVQFSPKELGDLRMRGCAVRDSLSLQAFLVASILGN